MIGWWEGLSTVNQWFYGAACFFSVFFVWQLLAALFGLAGGGHEAADGADIHGDMVGDVHADVDADMTVDADADAIGDGGDTYVHFEHGAVEDAQATLAAFKLLSIRSVLAFCTLFCWAGAMYLNRGEQVALVLLYSVLWGVAAMLGVAAIFYLFRRLTETGSANIATCLGKTGSVYLDILPEGQGEARLLVSGAVSYVKARAVGDSGIKAGTPVRVVRILDSTTVQVEPLGENSGDNILQGKEE